jgi:DNA-binding NtrC family response regulator
MNKLPIKILIIDDEKSVREILRLELSLLTSHVAEADGGRKALEMMTREEFDVLLLDLNMPGLHGIEVLKHMRDADMETEAIVFTGHGSVSTAVEAMKLGAYDYLMKPFSVAELLPVIEKAAEKKKLRVENLLLKTQVKRHWEAPVPIAKSETMLEALETAKTVAATDFPVLITGETGTGKELVARIIHQYSSRAERSYVVINCGALPENMIESELFGFEKGAFTGAYARKPGLLEIADGGTLFLDEIGDMPPALQIKLLRVIETGRFYRLGGTQELEIKTRVVSATNKDLKTLIDTGAFRQDLFYRIAAMTVHVPPLRERPEDIVPLIEYFMCGSQAFKDKRFSPEALDVLTRYPWPGNVRELQHVVCRTLLLAKKSLVEPLDLPSDMLPGRDANSARIEDLERRHILATLERFHGDRHKTAETLGVHPKTLSRKLAGYKFDQ